MIPDIIQEYRSISNMPYLVNGITFAETYAISGFTLELLPKLMPFSNFFTEFSILKKLFQPLFSKIYGRLSFK